MRATRAMARATSAPSGTARRGTARGVGVGVVVVDDDNDIGAVDGTRARRRAARSRETRSRDDRSRANSRRCARRGSRSIGWARARCREGDCAPEVSRAAGDAGERATADAAERRIAHGILRPEHDGGGEEVAKTATASNRRGCSGTPRARRTWRRRRRRSSRASSGRNRPRERGSPRKSLGNRSRALRALVRGRRRRIYPPTTSSRRRSCRGCCLRWRFCFNTRRGIDGRSSRRGNRRAGAARTRGELAAAIVRECVDDASSYFRGIFDRARGKLATGAAARRARAPTPETRRRFFLGGFALRLGNWRVGSWE